MKKIFTMLCPALCIGLLLGSLRNLNAQEPQGGRIENNTAIGGAHFFCAADASSQPVFPPEQM